MATSENADTHAEIAVRRRPAVWLNLLLACTALALLAALWFRQTVDSARSEFGIEQLNFLSGHVTLIVGVQIAVLLLAYAALRALASERLARRVTAALGGLFLCLNLVTLLLVHVDDFGRMGSAVQLLSIVFVFAIGAVLFANMLSSRFTAGLLTAAAAAGLVVTGLTGAEPTAVAEAAVDENGDPLPVGTAPKGAPNVYFVGFDSMIPKVLAEEIVGVDDPAYLSVIESEGFRRFENGFAGFVATKPALNSMMMLDPDLFVAGKNRSNYINGLGASTATTHLRAHGYKTNFVFRSAYFGAEKGPYIDAFDVSQRESDICEHAISASAFLGYCAASVTNVTQAALVPFGLNNTPEESDWPERTFNHIRNDRRDGPWFTLTHLYWPGHTGKDFDRTDPEQMRKWQARFREKAERGAELLQRYVDTVKARDPDAIILIYGDHGTFTNRHLAGSIYALPEGETEQRDWVLDQRGIVVAVWPPTACSDDFDRVTRKGYITNIQAARTVISCVTGKDPLGDAPYTHDMPTQAYSFKRRLKYEDFLYE